jgi:hypothetical protein
VARYLFIATVIVFVAGGIVAAVHRHRADVRIAPSQSTGSPSPPRTEAATSFFPGAVTGNAPWAFDAVMDCFHHERTFRGTLERVRRHLPTGAWRLPDGWVLASGPCTARVARDTARLCRGPCSRANVDVRIPPRVHVFVEGGHDEAPAEVRRVYVLRWTAEDDARLDRLTAMPGATVTRDRAR